ncbi:hypothetical protein BH23CHL5_BH23CHL5_08420 [soil metagenome]
MVNRALAIPTPLIFLGAIVTACLLLWRQGALSDIGPALRGASLWQMATAMVLYSIGLLLLCLRWHVLVQMIDGNKNLLRSSEAFVTSVALNYAAPLSLALPSRALLTMRALGLSKTQTAGLTFWEVAADLLVLSGLTAIWLATGGWRAGQSHVDRTWVVSGAMLALLAAVAVGLAFSKVRRMQKLAKELLIRVAPGLAYPRTNPGLAAGAFMLSLLFWVTQGGVLWILLRAIDRQNPELLLVLGLISMPILVGMLSPIPGGAGIREALMIAVAGVHGASEASALLAGITYRVALFAALPILYLAIRAAIFVKADDRGTMASAPADGAHGNSGGERDN